MKKSTLDYFIATILMVLLISVPRTFAYTFTVSNAGINSGNEVCVEAAIYAGIQFFAGYPITPASDILHQLSAYKNFGVITFQAEDEIAAMGFCIGAALTGARTMTATSGPGISLYSESIGAAIMMEVPLVIVDVQRMGPATGGATTVAQGDTQFFDDFVIGHECGYFLARFSVANWTVISLPRKLLPSSCREPSIITEVKPWSMALKQVSGLLP